MFVLVGEGPNDVNIPALVFSTREAAIAKCEEIFGDDGGRPLKNGNIRWVCDGNEFDEDLLAKTYTSYYGGCGECYAFTLMEVEEGKPFVKFNLD